MYFQSDDGAIVYFNGHEAMRIPSTLEGEDDYFLTAPPNGGEGSIVQTGTSSLRPGENVIAVSVHNASATDSDLAFRCQWVQSRSEISTLAFPIPLDFVSPLSEWRASAFDPAQVADLSLSGVRADPDADRLSNLMEYVYGTDPLVEDPFDALTGIGLFPTPDESGIRPRLNLPQGGLPDEVAIRFQQNLNLAEGYWSTAAMRFPETPWISPSGRQSDIEIILDREAPEAFYRFEYELMPWVTDVP